MRLHWQTLGEGKQHLVMLHGWGLNSAVWLDLLSRLRPHFCIHLIDLPGYGASQPYQALNVTEMAKHVLACLPPESHLLGWSMGGLVATRLAIDFPWRVKTLINVSSSPCFSQKTAWPGMSSQVMRHFRQQLQSHYQPSVDRFIALQTVGTSSAQSDIRKLRQVIGAQPMASQSILNKGLEILSTTDLRPELLQLQLPILRVYGALDALVPVSIATEVAAMSVNCQSVIMDHAGHAPFIAHPDAFSEIIISFCHRNQ